VRRNQRGGKSFPVRGSASRAERQRHHANHERTLGLRRAVSEWVEAQEIAWTREPGNLRDVARQVQAVNSRHLVAELRHNYTNYDRLKADSETMVRGLCSQCYRQFWCESTFGEARIMGCEFAKLAQGQLYERATRLILERLDIPFGDGWCWRRGAVGAIAATWADQKMPTLEEILESTPRLR
jgi:hypothetical protein